MHEEQGFSFRSLFYPFTSVKAIHWIIFIGLCTFSVGLFNNFVGDDNTQILNNEAVHSLSNLPAFFLESRLTTGTNASLGATYFKPFLDTSYALTYAAFGANIFPFHLFQIILYIANACLVFLIFKKFVPLSIAFFLSLIFLVHPINSETALYIADTQDVLFFFFGSLSLWIIMSYSSQRAIVASVILLFFSLLSKETGILFLLISLLYSFLYRRKGFLPLLGYSALSLAFYFILRIHAIGIFSSSLINAPIGRLSLTQRALSIPDIIYFYIKTFFFPKDLSSSWQWISLSINPLALFFDLLFLVMCILPLFILRDKAHRKLLLSYIFFFSWFLIGLIFHLQLLPLDQTVAERWFYFPVVGLLGMIGILLLRFQVNLTKRWILPMMLILIFLLLTRSFYRGLDFKDDLRLATHDIRVSPTAYNLEYIISHAYYEQGRLDEAKTHAEKSVQLFPYITNYTNLGAIYSRMGDYRSAKSAYKKALEYGDDSLPYINIASLAFVYGDPKENTEFIKNIALKKYPQNGALWFDLAVLEYMHGSREDGRKYLQKAKAYNQNPNMDFIEYVFTQNKPLHIRVLNGGVTFYTEK